MTKKELTPEALVIFNGSKNKTYPYIERTLNYCKLSIVLELAIYLRACTIDELVCKLNDNNL